MSYADNLATVLKSVANANNVAAINAAIVCPIRLPYYSYERR